jgi:hypothetical protein
LYRLCCREALVLSSFFKKCFNPVTGNLLEGAFPGDAAETAAGNKAMASIALLRLQNYESHPGAADAL